MNYRATKPFLCLGELWKARFSSGPLSPWQVGGKKVFPLRPGQAAWILHSRSLWGKKKGTHVRTTLEQPEYNAGDLCNMHLISFVPTQQSQTPKASLLRAIKCRYWSSYSEHVCVSVIFSLFAEVIDDPCYSRLNTIVLFAPQYGWVWRMIGPI